MNSHRSIRLFLSSTFRDFGEERDLLVRKVFPALRARLKDRFVELVDVDLRWGITAEEAERGEVLPICLAEIDRSRPYFIGMLGERYGWIPPQEGYASDLIERQPWLKKHQGGKSVTELEILHGVLKNKRMKTRAFFYFRSPAYAHAKGGHYVPDSKEDRQRQLELKRRIKDSGYSVTGYRDPEALAKRMERDLWKLLDAEFPATDIPDAFERESTRHEAYAAPRRRLYLGGDEYIEGLNALLKKNVNRILITGQSGGGKSALIANALAKYRSSKTHLLEHYLGSSSDAADTLALVRRVIEYIRRVTGNTDPLAADPEELFDSVSTWLAVASAFAQKKRTRWIFVFDALNNLNGYRDLKWFPAYLPERIQIVVSCLEGEVKDALETKGVWDSLLVKPLDTQGRSQLLTEYLKRFNKSLPTDLLNQALGHPLANNPLWLKTLAEELRLFGSHEDLNERLNALLGPPGGKGEDEPPSVDDLFEHVLHRIEGDQGRKLVRDALTAIWASRAGLSEPELLEVLSPHSAEPGRANKANKLPPVKWAPVRNALDEMLLESGGRIIFGHDYVRIAVRDRYLPSESLQRNAHKRLAQHFAKRKVDERVAEELPYQLRESNSWAELLACLKDQVLSQAFIKYRGMQEVLGYWLAWELAADGAIETALESAWRRWALPRDSYDCARVAGILERFMSYAGRPGKFALKVAKISANTFDKLPRCSNQAIEALINLAELYRVRSEHEAALKCAKRAIDSSTKKAVISGEIWRCWLHYGDILLAISRYDDAESAYSKALDCAALFKGNQSTEANFARLNRAWVSYTVGNYLKAVPEFQALFASLSINPGLRDPKTTQAANNLALLHFNLCKFDDAEKLARLSLDNDQVMFGSAHWMASMSALNLSWIEHAQGATDMANARCIGVVKNFDKTMGTTHPLWALAKSTQGWFLLVAGDIKGAETRYEIAIEVLTKAVGEDHIDLLTPVDGLGWLYCRDSAYTKAAIYFERAYQLVLRNFGKEHPSICIPLCGLATTALAMGDNNLSQSLSKKALAIAERDFGLDHLDTAQAYTCLGATLNALGFFSDASENFEKAYRSRACILSASHPDVVSALKNFNLSKNLNHNQFNLFFTARRFSGSSVM